MGCLNKRVSRIITRLLFFFFFLELLFQNKELNESVFVKSIFYMRWVNYFEENNFILFFLPFKFFKCACYIEILFFSLTVKPFHFGVSVAMLRGNWNYPFLGVVDA